MQCKESRRSREILAYKDAFLVQHLEGELGTEFGGGGEQNASAFLVHILVYV